MVIETKDQISPSLHRMLRQYSEKNDLSISKEIIKSAIEFLKNHTSLTISEIDQVIESAVSSVYKKGYTHQNYEGNKEVNPTEFGREVILVCTENGIKIKRVPANVETEVKDKFEGIDEDVLDNAIIILDMQPDLSQEDRGRIIMQSVIDSLNDKDSFDGDMDYEVFGERVKDNLKELRKEKESELAVDKLMDMFVSEDDYYGESIADAWPWYRDRYGLTDDHFADYFDNLFLEGWDVPIRDNYEGQDEFAKAKPKLQAARGRVQKQKQVVKKKQQRAKSLEKVLSKVHSGQKVNGKVGSILASKGKSKVESMLAKKQAKTAENIAKAEDKLRNQQAKKDQLKQKVQEQKAKKKARKDAEAALQEQKTAIINQQNMPAAPITSAAEELMKQQAALPEVPQGGGGASGGGGGESPLDMGGEYQEPEYEEEEDSEEEMDTQEEEQSEEEDEMSDRQYSKQQYNKGLAEEQEEWFPEEEDDEEIANFFGLYKKKAEPKEKKEPLNELLQTDSFIGDSEASNNKGWIIIIVIIIVAVICFRKKIFSK